MAAEECMRGGAELRAGSERPLAGRETRRTPRGSTRTTMPLVGWLRHLPKVLGVDDREEDGHARVRDASRSGSAEIMTLKVQGIALQGLQWYWPMDVRRRIAAISD